MPEENELKEFVSEPTETQAPPLTPPLTPPEPPAPEEAPPEQPSVARFDDRLLDVVKVLDKRREELDEFVRASSSVTKGHFQLAKVEVLLRFFAKFDDLTKDNILRELGLA